MMELKELGELGVCGGGDSGMGTSLALPVTVGGISRYSSTSLGSGRDMTLPPTERSLY